MKKVSNILILFVIVFCTCRKYPEDGKLSLSTSYQRLTKHPWKLININIDGADSTNKSWPVGSSPANGPVAFFNLNGFELTFGAKKADDPTDYSLNDAGPSWWWYFANHKKELRIQMAAADGTSMLPYGTNRNWKILKLTDDDLFLEITGDAPKHVTIKFSKQ
jgi:hypothetical protein